MKTARSTWVVAGLVLSVATVLGLLALMFIGFEVGTAGFFVGLVMAAVPVPFYIAFALWIDRFEPEPPWLLALAFVWGGAIAVFFSLIFNVLNEGVLTAAVGAAAGSTLTAVLTAPFVEELTKGTALILLYLWKRDEFDNVTDGIVYATMVGLGFAMTENIEYYGKAVAMHAGAAGVFFVRGIMGPFAHPLFTSMTGIGLGAARESDKTWVQWAAPTGGLALAMVLHGIWNLSASFGLAFFAAYFLVMIPAFLGVATIAIFSLRREANLIRVHLATVVAEGVLSRDDVIVVTSVGKRISESMNALTSGGFAKWRLRRQFHGLAADLAFHCWRASRQATPDAQAVREELIAEIRTVRAKLGLPREIEHPEPALVARLSREIPLPELPADIAPVSLVCTAGPLAGESFQIGYTGVQIGRDAHSAQIVVKDPRVSRQHVWIGHGQNGIVAIDRGSANGTWLNGQRITEAALQPGDRLEISDRVATFELQRPTA